MVKKQLKSTATRPGGAINDATLALTSLPPAKTVVPAPEDSRGYRKFDFSKFYGIGCDVVTYAAQQILTRMVTASFENGGKSLSGSTIVGYFNGLEVFLPFCAMMASPQGRELYLDDIDRNFIGRFVHHLRQFGGRVGNQRYKYSTTKAVLVAMGQSGWIAKDIFPRNPFPKTNRSMTG